MLSKNKDWFYFDSYFRQWHRVLVRGGGDYTHQISVLLTPLNGWDTEESVKRVADVTILSNDIRYSPSNYKREWTHHLPDNIELGMIEHLGEEKANFLLHANILPLIDWKKYERHQNGGCPLDLCTVDLKFDYTHIYDATVPGYSRSENIVLIDERKYLELAQQEKPKSGLLIGGLVVMLPDFYLRMVGIYDVNNGRVSIEMNYANAKEGREVISRFSRRLSEQWDIEIQTHLSKLNQINEIPTIAFAHGSMTFFKAKEVLTALKQQPPKTIED